MSDPAVPVPPPGAPPLHERALPDLKSGLKKAIPGLLGLVVLLGLVGWLARDPVTAMATWFVSRAGLGGVFAAEVILDTIPGVGAQPVIFLAYAGGLGFWPILAVSGAGGVVAGGLGWCIGRGLSRNRWTMDWLFRSGFAALLLRHRTRAVFAAAFLPFPYALTTIAAGAVGVSLRETLTGALGRYVKAYLNLLVMAFGWGLAS